MYGCACVCAEMMQLNGIEICQERGACSLRKKVAGEHEKRPKRTAGDQLHGRLCCILFVADEILTEFLPTKVLPCCILMFSWCLVRQTVICDAEHICMFEQCAFAQAYAQQHHSSMQSLLNSMLITSCYVQEVGCLGETKLKLCSM